MPDGKTIQVKIETVIGKSGTAKKIVSDLEKEVKASQKRIERGSKATARAIDAHEKTLAAAETKRQKQKANEFLRTLKKMESASKTAGTKINSAFSSAFKGGFLGGLVGTLSVQLARLPRMFRNTLDEMVRLAAERENAFKGLESIAIFKNVDPNDARRMVDDLRLVKAGILSTTDAVTGLKNLLATGFSLPQAVMLLERFSDSAAFGKQAALSYGDAIRSATEGIKNQNSILVDNAGVTKNISVILKERGFTMQDLSDKQKSENALQALYHGLLVETQAQVGDADKLTKGWTGSTAALSMAQERLYAAMGDIISRNPELLAFIQMLTRRIEGSTTALNQNESQTRSTFNTWVSFIGRAGIVGMDFVDTMTTGFSQLGNSVAAIFAGMGFNVHMAMAFFGKAINQFIEPVNHLKNLLGLIIPQLSYLQNVPNIPTFDVAGSVKSAEWYAGSFKGVTAAIPASRDQLWQRRQQREAEFRQLVEGMRANPPANVVPPGGTDTGGGGAGVARGSRDGRSKAAEAGLAEFVSNRIQAEFEKAMRNLPQAMQGQIAAEAGKSGIPLDLAFAQIFSESRFDPKADSGQAKGLTQFTPATAKRFGYNINDLVKNPEKALSAWGKYMSFLFNRYGDWELATLAYHQGEGTVDKLVAQLGKGAGTSAARVIGPKGKAYIAQISALSGIRGKQQFQPGDPRDIEEYYKRTELTTAGEVGTELFLAGREKEIEANEKIAAAYREIADAIFNANQHTKEEIFLRDVKLGKYPELNAEQVKEIANGYRLLDVKEKQTEVDRKASDALADYRAEQQRLFEDTARGFEDMLTDLATGNFKSLWDRLRHDMLQQFIRPASQYLAQLFSGSPIGGLAAGTGGFNFGGFGGGIGPGGTPNFNPNIGGGGSGNINFGQILNQQGGGFPLGGNAATTGGGNNINFGGIGGGPGGGGAGGLSGFLRGIGGGSRMAGLGAGLGSIGMMAGGAIGGKWGNLLTMAGMGAQMGAMFGPWGAAIGAAIGTGAGFISMLFGGGDNAIKKLKKAAASEFGINVKDKSILKQLKQIGEGYFGKGQVGKNAVAVVRTEEGMNILRAYAESSGQSGLKIDRLNYGDETWSGNQFGQRFGGYRAMGGPVTAGYSYVVGEKRPELFTPAQNGNISPTVGGTDIKTTMMLAEAIYELKDELAKLKTQSAGVIVREGARDAGREINNAINSEYERGSSATESLFRRTGQYV